MEHITVNTYRKDKYYSRVVRAVGKILVRSDVVTPSDIFIEMGNLNKLRQLFETFGRKQDMLHILDSSMNATGIQIFIGEESGFQALDECSLVTKSYQIDDEVVGVVGVIGPTRMAYDRVIPIVDLTAQLLSSALKYSTN